MSYKFICYLRYASLLIFNIILAPLYLLFFILGLFLTFIPIFPSKIGLKNFKGRLGIGSIKAHFFLSIIYLNYFVYMIESFVFWHFRVLSVVNEKDFAQFISGMNNKYANGKICSYLMLGAHYGNIEVLGSSLSRVLRKDYSSEYAVLAQFPRNKVAAFFLETYRKTRNIKTINSTSRNLIETLRKHANADKSIAILVDQKPKVKGAFYKFIGEYAAFPYRGLEKFTEMGCPVLYLTAQRIFPGCFRLLFSEGANIHKSEFDANEPLLGNFCAQISEIHPHTKAYIDEKVSVPLAGFVGWLQKIVTEKPLQWFWDYNKWSRNALQHSNCSKSKSQL